MALKLFLDPLLPKDLLVKLFYSNSIFPRWQTYMFDKRFSRATHSPKNQAKYINIYIWWSIVERPMAYISFRPVKKRQFYCYFQHILFQWREYIPLTISWNSSRNRLLSASSLQLLLLPLEYCTMDAHQILWWSWWYTTIQHYCCIGKLGCGCCVVAAVCITLRRQPLSIKEFIGSILYVTPAGMVLTW